MRVVSENSRCEGPKGLTKFDLQVHRRLHLGRAGVAEDRAASQRSRSKLHTTCHVPDDVLLRKKRRNDVAHLVFGFVSRVDCPLRIEKASRLFRSVRRPEKRPFLRVLAVIVSWPPEKLIPGKKGGAEGSSRVSCGRLNPDVLEGSFAKNTAVGDAVEGDPSGEGEVRRAGALVCVACHSKDNFFGDGLDRRRDVHLSLRDLRFGSTRRAIE